MSPSSKAKPLLFDQSNPDGPLSFEKVWFMFQETDRKVYGAVAFISEDAGTTAMAEKNGLFVIRATGESANIVHSDAFIPKVW